MVRVGSLLNENNIDTYLLKIYAYSGVAESQFREFREEVQTYLRLHPRSTP